MRVGGCRNTVGGNCFKCSAVEGKCHRGCTAKGVSHHLTLHQHISACNSTRGRHIIRALRHVAEVFAHKQRAGFGGLLSFIFQLHTPPYIRLGHIVAVDQLRSIHNARARAVSVGRCHEIVAGNRIWVVLFVVIIAGVRPPISANGIKNHLTINHFHLHFGQVVDVVAHSQAVIYAIAAIAIDVHILSRKAHLSQRAFG